MKIAEVLTPVRILPNLCGQDKPEILNELATCLATDQSAIDHSSLKAVLAERERLGSTAIGDGIAIPHGKIASVKQILGVFGRCSRGVDFDSLDGNPTHLFFLLVAPEDSASLHLKALARVSRLFRDNSFRDQLMSASEASEIYRLILEEDSRH